MRATGHVLPCELTVEDRMPALLALQIQSGGNYYLVYKGFDEVLGGGYVCGVFKDS